MCKIGKIAAFFGILLTINAIWAKSDTPHCAKDAEGFRECLKEQHDKNKDDDIKKLNKVGNRINQCFKDNGCPVPANGTGSGHVFNAIEGSWQSLSKDAKTCISTAYSHLALKAINACLKEQKVDELKELNSEDSELDVFSNKTHPHVRYARGLLKVVLAVKGCREDVGAKQANGTVTCMVTVKKDVHEAVCKRVDKCRKDKVSDTCHEQGKKLQKALCSCGQARLKDMIKSLEELESKDKAVNTVEVATIYCKTCKDDHKSVTDEAVKCFKEKKVELPGYDEYEELLEGLMDYLSLAVHDPTGPAHAVLGLLLSIESEEITKSQMAEIRQVLTDILNNVDCGCPQS